MVEMWLQGCKREREMGNSLVVLGKEMYTIAIDAWANSGDKRATSKAEQILKLMKEMYKLGHKDCNPNVYA